MVARAGKSSAAKSRPVAPAKRGSAHGSLDSLRRKLNVAFNALEAVTPMLREVPEQAAELRKVIELNMETDAPPVPAILDQARRNAAARDAFIAECGGLLTSAQVAELAGSGARNASQLAWRLKEEGRIFSVEHRSQTFYPALQFDPQTEKPREVIGELIAVLAPLYSGWSLALWFAAANDWLDGAPPYDVLADRATDVLDAASAENQHARCLSRAFQTRRRTFPRDDLSPPKLSAVRDFRTSTASPTGRGASIPARARDAFIRSLRRADTAIPTLYAGASWEGAVMEITITEP
jgi:hypothetical protein